MPTQARQSFDRRFMKPGRQSVLLFLPEEYNALIGLVVVYWGHFEVIFASCLQGLIEGEAADGAKRKTARWQRQPFKDRSKLFREIVTNWVSTWNARAAVDLVELLDAATRLQAKRNIIAHGTYGYSVLPESSVADSCYALNNSTGEKMPFDELVLKEIYHDISHLTADLVTAFRAIGSVEGPFHTIRDDEILRIYNETVHPWNPNPALRPEAVQSSAASDVPASPTHGPGHEKGC